jgi:SAM-dependent methyltransferase
MLDSPTSSPSLHERVIRGYFETTSAQGAMADQPAFDRVVDGVSRLLGNWAPQAGEVIVDLGSGMGETCRLALRRGAANATGINLSVGENVFAREHAPGATFLDADLLSGLATIATDSVDRVIALNILEHLDKDMLAAVLEEVTRILRPTGRFVAMTPNATSPFGTMTRYWDITHQLAFTPSSMRQVGRVAGFTSFSFRECGPRPHGLVSGIRYLLWQGVRMTIKLRLLIEVASTKGGVYTADMLTMMQK